MSELKLAMTATHILEKLSDEARREVLAYFSEGLPKAVQTPSTPPPESVRRRIPGRSDPDHVLELVTDFLKEHPEGVRLEKLRAETGQDKPDLVKAIKMGLETKRLTKTGEKRATTYFLPRPATGVGAVIRRQK